MHGRFTRFVAALGLVLGLVVGCLVDGRVRPVAASPTEPGGSWISGYFDELRLLSPGGACFVMTGPCERLDLARWVGAKNPGEERSTGRGQWLAAMLRQDLGPEAALDESGRLVWVLDWGATGELERGCEPIGESMVRSWLYLPGGLSLWTSMRTTANAPHLHRVETQPWRHDWSASCDFGGIGYRKGALSVFAGRDEASWGASRERGLLFSGAAPTLDMLRLTLGGKHVLFTSLHSELRRGRADPWDAGVKRFVAAHRLEVLVGTRWDFSVSEVVLYGGEGRGFEPGYLNPLAPFYAEQWNSYWNDNLLFAADVMFRLPGQAEIKGEVVVDDFQIDPGPAPNKLGFGLAIDAVNPLVRDRSLVGCSYFRVANWTYGHAVAWNGFVQEGKVLGFPGGPDGDRFEAWSSWAPRNSVELKASYALTRQGEGRVSDRRPEAGFKTGFPSGTVARAHGVSAGVTWRPSYPLQVQALARWSSESNVANVRGVTASGFKASLAVTYNLRVWRRGA